MNTEKTSCDIKNIIMSILENFSSPYIIECNSIAFQEMTYLSKSELKFLVIGEDDRTRDHYDLLVFEEQPMVERSLKDSNFLKDLNVSEYNVDINNYDFSSYVTHRKRINEDFYDCKVEEANYIESKVIKKDNYV